jgi:hypothetical protein
MFSDSNSAADMPPLAEEGSSTAPILDANYISPAEVQELLSFGGAGREELGQGPVVPRGNAHDQAVERRWYNKI